jgi:hypothetical protein
MDTDFKIKIMHTSFETIAVTPKTTITAITRQSEQPPPAIQLIRVNPRNPRFILHPGSPRPYLPPTHPQRPTAVIPWKAQSAPASNSPR